MENMEKLDKSFYKDKVVLVTGHTGFKGSWLTRMLLSLGAKVIGFSLKPSTFPNLFDQLGNKKDIINIFGDIRDYDKLLKVFIKYKPEIVFHLAAQPLVRDSYVFPRCTYETNVLGTINVLECCRLTKSVKSIINVTTDKVYKNDDSGNSFVEDCSLDGEDPYSNSKSCSDILTHSYRASFFSKLDIPISCMRAGNVIGGGDYSKDRIIPDCFRAITNKKKLLIRNPNSIRPYQYVIDVLYVYLLVAQEQYLNHSVQGEYNIGPTDEQIVKTIDLVNLLNEKVSIEYEISKEQEEFKVEKKILKLNSNKLNQTFKQLPRTNIKDTISKIVDFYKALLNDNIKEFVDKEILNFIK